MSEFFAQLSGFTAANTNYNIDNNDTDDFDNGYVDDNGDFISFSGTEESDSTQDLTFEDVIEKTNSWES